jgi:hypothetical protein
LLHEKLLHEAKLEFLCEPYGGPWRQNEIMPKVDWVMTEFWTGGGRYAPYEVDSTIAALRQLDLVSEANKQQRLLVDSPTAPAN